MRAAQTMAVRAGLIRCDQSVQRWEQVVEPSYYEASIPDQVMRRGRPTWRHVWLRERGGGRGVRVDNANTSSQEFFRRVNLQRLPGDANWKDGSPKKETRVRWSNEKNYLIRKCSSLKAARDGTL